MADRLDYNEIIVGYSRGEGDSARIWAKIGDETAERTMTRREWYEALDLYDAAAPLVRKLTGQIYVRVPGRSDRVVKVND